MRIKGYCVVGLTGQSGAGKTTVSDVFKENGYTIINADKIARELQSKQSTLKRLSKVFGEDIINEDGSLNRKTLGRIVFSDKTELSKLNKIMFPLVTTEINKVIFNTNNNFFLLDAPQLFESGFNNNCTITISVIAPRDTLINRIMERDNISKKDAENRLNSQKSEIFFRENADFVLENNSSIENLKKQALELINTIKKKL